MNIAILGYGKEGHAIENYFKAKHASISIFDNINRKDLENYDFSIFDMVFRSPSVPPIKENWTSSTKYFFENCPCPIIGVTGTKGKGTTCSMITDILRNMKKSVHLVGNIGYPAISVLDSIKPNDVVVYEMSSFQLWDLSVSPSVSVVLRIEPDHLNVHKDYAEYKSAKSNIAKYQKEFDKIIYFKNNQDSIEIAKQSKGKKLTYPISSPSKTLENLLFFLNVPGPHNRENAEAALLAVSAYLDEDFESFLENNFDSLKETFKNFVGLPHRLEFVRNYKGINFYDDNFSTTVPSLEVAIKSFPDEDIILIAGGRDKTNNEDLPEINELLSTSKNIKKVILIGESGHALYEKFPNEKFILAESLSDAIKKSVDLAELTESSTVLMSPAAASFDMFENVYDRGEKYQSLIKSLK